MRRVAAVTAIVTLALAGCSDEPDSVELYDRAPVPAVPDRTSPIPAPEAALADGQYWAQTATVEGEVVRFQLVQAFFGPACTEALGAPACPDDHGVLDEPSRDIVVDVTGVSPLTVVGADRQNYAVTADELVALIGGAPPSASAPEGFEYTPYPFLVTVRSQIVTGVQQIWMA